MPGASTSTRRVTHVNANWRPEQGGFEFLVVTEDDERHVLPASPAEAAAVTAMTQARDVVLLFDPDAGTLIVTNLLGEWLVSDRSALSR